MIGILSFHWADDYGAMLQGYALKAYLNKYEEAVFIPYVPKALRSRYRLIRYNKKSRLRRKIYEIGMEMLPWTFYHNLKTKYKMRSFRKKYLTDAHRKLDTSKDICEFGKEIDTFVVGSDQVWNPVITEGFQEGYFCTFRQWRKKQARYISYAASIGGDSLEEKYDQALSGLLTNFDVISLREESAIPYIKALWNRRLTVVLDPVFLLDKEEWEQLLPPRRRKTEKYIAVYDTEYNKAMAGYLKEIESSTGFKVVIIKPRKGKYQWTEYERYASGCGPIEFLELLYYAEYVVTNSFHGTAMSIIFHKPFAVFTHSSRGARMRHILKVSCLESRMACPETGYKKVDIEETIDWKAVDNALKEAAEDSKAFIRKEILKGHD